MAAALQGARSSKTVWGVSYSCSGLNYACSIGVVSLQNVPASLLCQTAIEKAAQFLLPLVVLCHSYHLSKFFLFSL